MIIAYSQAQEQNYLENIYADGIYAEGIYENTQE